MGDGGEVLNALGLGLRSALGRGEGEAGTGGDLMDQLRNAAAFVGGVDRAVAEHLDVAGQGADTFRLGQPLVAGAVHARIDLVDRIGDDADGDAGAGQAGRLAEGVGLDDVVAFIDRGGAVVRGVDRRQADDAVDRGQLVQLVDRHEAGDETLRQRDRGDGHVQLGGQGLLQLGVVGRRVATDVDEGAAAGVDDEILALLGEEGVDLVLGNRHGQAGLKVLQRDRAAERAAGRGAAGSGRAARQTGQAQTTLVGRGGRVLLLDLEEGGRRYRVVAGGIAGTDRLDRTGVASDRHRGYRAGVEEGRVDVQQISAVLEFDNRIGRLRPICEDVRTASATAKPAATA